jgi:hypothetical protein
VMRRCEGEERGLTPGEGEERRAHGATVPLGAGPVTGMRETSEAEQFWDRAIVRSCPLTNP